MSVAGYFYNSVSTRQRSEHSARDSECKILIFHDFWAKQIKWADTYEKQTHSVRRIQSDASGLLGIPCPLVSETWTLEGTQSSLACP